MSTSRTRSKKPFASPTSRPPTTPRDRGRPRRPGTGEQSRPTTPATSQDSGRSRRSQHSARSQRSTKSQLSSISFVESEKRYSSASTDDEDGSTDSSLQSLVGGSVNSKRPSEYKKKSSRTNSAGLETPYQKHVLQEIEEAGGIAIVTAKKKLGQHLDDRASSSEDNLKLYGERYSKERKRVDNKIRYWAELSTVDYNTVLESFGISPAGESNDQEAASDTSSLPDFVNISTPSAKPSMAKTKKSSTKKPTTSSSKKKAPATKPTPDFESYRDTNTKSQSSDEEDEKIERRATRMSSVGKMYRNDQGVVTQIILVDHKNLEMTPHPIKLYPVWTGLESIDDPNKKLSGFMISCRCHYNDVMGGTHKVRDKAGTWVDKEVKPFKFKAKVTGHDKIQITVPLLDWSDRGNDDERIREYYNGEAKVAIQAIDGQRNDFIKSMGKKQEDYETAVKIFELQFPSEARVNLDGSIIKVNKKAQKKEAGVLSLQAFDIESDIKLENQEDPLEFVDFNIDGRDVNCAVFKANKQPRLYWFVADKNMTERHEGAYTEDIDSEEEDDAVKAMQNNRSSVDPPGRSSTTGNTGIPPARPQPVPLGAHVSQSTTPSSAPSMPFAPTARVSAAPQSPSVDDMETTNLGEVSPQSRAANMAAAQKEDDVFSELEASMLLTMTEGSRVLDEVGGGDDTVMGGENYHRKRSNSVSAETSAEVPLRQNFAPMNDPVHCANIISQLPGDHKAYIMGLHEEQRSNALNECLNNFYSQLTPHWKGFVDNATDQLQKFDAMKHGFKMMNSEHSLGD